MHKVTRNQIIYKMSPENVPVLMVDAGQAFEFETEDALHGQIKNESDGFDGLNWDQINPATGPVYVNGANPGDVLSVKIKKIEVADTGVVMCGPGMGVLGHLLEKSASKVVKIADGFAHFSPRFKLPLNKMVGVIGVAPPKGEIPCGVPDFHGGNMDCKEIREGATVLLPVFVPGALLSLGDLHAVMADGEAGVSGIEVSGSVVVTVDVIKGVQYPLPMIENDTHYMTIASHESLDTAVDMAAQNMAKFLVAKYDIGISEAVMLVSLAGDIRICQVVDPKKTARVEFRKM